MLDTSNKFDLRGWYAIPEGGRDSLEWPAASVTCSCFPCLFVPVDKVVVDFRQGKQQTESRLFSDSAVSSWTISSDHLQIQLYDAAPCPGLQFHRPMTPKIPAILSVGDPHRALPDPGAMKDLILSQPLSRQRHLPAHTGRKFPMGTGEKQSAPKNKLDQTMTQQEVRIFAII